MRAIDRMNRIMVVDHFNPVLGFKPVTDRRSGAANANRAPKHRVWLDV